MGKMNFKRIYTQTVKFGKRLFERMKEADVFGLSAQLAFFFLLSLFPFLLFLVTLLGYLPINEQIVTEFIGGYLPVEVAEMIETNLNYLLNNRSGSLLSVSIVGTLWSASNGFNAIKRALNRAYRVEQRQRYIVARLISVILTISILGVICLALLLPVFGKAIGDYIFSFLNLSEGLDKIFDALRWVISSIIFFIVLFVLYRFAPHTHVKWRDVIFGSLFATIGWQTVSFAFSFYVDTLGNYSATYGSLGTVIILMIWFYISGIIIITGGVINAVIADRE